MYIHLHTPFYQSFSGKSGLASCRLIFDPVIFILSILIRQAETSCPHTLYPQGTLAGDYVCGQGTPWYWSRSFYRSVGRPYTSWMDTLKSDLSLHNLTFEDAIELALDKSLWTLLVASGATQWHGVCRIMMMMMMYWKFITGWKQLWTMKYVQTVIVTEMW